MRFRYISILVVFALSSASLASAQEVSFLVVDSVNKLPAPAKKAVFRIQIMESSRENLPELKQTAKAFTLKYRQNSYLSCNGSKIQLLTGDFPEKSFAKQRLKYLKSNYKDGKVVKALNDSIKEIISWSRKKVISPLRKESIPEPGINEMKQELAAAVKDGNVDFSVWDNPKYMPANSAKDATYLTEEEKKVYLILNRMRMNPRLFSCTYLSHLKEIDGPYSKSLLQDLDKMKPQPILKPDSLLWESARCHAEESGKSGYVGHNRTKCRENFRGECCSYGPAAAAEIVECLLVDQNVESLGHRKICMGGYSSLGVSIKPHKTWRNNAVLDFGYKN